MDMKGQVLAPTTRELYDRDFYMWTTRNAELLRAGRLGEADLEHIAEELEDMGKREKHELESRLRVLITPLLKWQLQSERRSGSWRATIQVQREEMHELLAEMPSLRNLLRKSLPRVYRRAVTKASGETGLSRKMFPPDCPFDLEEILNPEILPE
jgi:hypothetical protein